MLNTQLQTFTDRREAITLFNLLRGRDPAKPWPLLPILTILAPGGSGKSTLLEYLRIQECQQSIPTAHLDFTLASTPKDLLPILVNLRDQLQQQDDGQGKYLTFPRFDLGALIAMVAPTPEDLASLGPRQLRDKLTAGKQFFESLSSLSSTLGYAIPYVGALFAGLNIAGQIKPLQDILGYLENSSGWRWYRMHGTATRLGATAGMKEVLKRLHQLSILGTQERERLIEELLPAAFLDDLLDALVETIPPHTWRETTNVVIFLDGFEALQASSSTTATRLLQALTAEPYRTGKTTPLLLVIGSRDLFLGVTDTEQGASFERRTAVHETKLLQRITRERYECWQHNLPHQQRFLRLTDLYLPLILHDFGLEDTRTYLKKIEDQEQLQVFTRDETLIQMIDLVAQGHPLFLALAAAAVIEAKACGRTIGPDELKEADVSPEIVRDHEQEPIAVYLLDLFLRQLPQAEQHDLIFCAAARFLDPAMLRAILELPTDLTARDRWSRYRRFTFLRALDEERLVLHPIVRDLLLRRLPSSDNPNSDYYRTHTRLLKHFRTAASKQYTPISQGKSDGLSQVEEAYHALALGDPVPAINVGIAARLGISPLWKLLLDTVKQAPTGLIPEEIEQQASVALSQAELNHTIKENVTSIILYTWLLAAPRKNDHQVAYLLHNLGEAYRILSGGDRQANLEQAIYYLTQALEVRTREAFPFEWAMTQHNLGSAYVDLPLGDRQANLEQAIHCFSRALEVRTRKAFPFNWAMTQKSLGIVYANLPLGDRQANLKRAIYCFTRSLEVHTREAFPFEWAITQNNLGNAYGGLPRGNQQANLKRAIHCFTRSLEVRTREALPFEWSMIQHNLGCVYLDLPRGNRQTNLEQAIHCFTQTLDILTREAFPKQWAMIQNSLGNAYSSLPKGDRQANLEQAIHYYTQVLIVSTRETFPVEWAATQNNLGNAYSSLPKGDRQANLEQAIYCFTQALEALKPMQIDDHIGVVYGNLERAQIELLLLKISEGKGTGS